MLKPRQQIAVGRMIIAVTVVVAQISVFLDGMKWGLRLKEEIRARQSTADSVANFLEQDLNYVRNLSRRIENSAQQPHRDPRHDRWVRELAQRQASAAILARKLPKYQRLAAYPWLRYPEGNESRVYLDEQTVTYLNRFVERRQAILWAGIGAAAFSLLLLIFLALLIAFARRFPSACRGTDDMKGTTADSSGRVGTEIDYKCISVRQVAEETPDGC